MRLTLLLLVTASTAAGAHAQTLNEFMIYPERNGSAATFTGRPARLQATAAQEGFTEVSPKAFRGVGDLDRRTCRVWGLYHWWTDENAGTKETYHVLFRKHTKAGQMDTSAAGLIGRVGPLSLPVSNGRRGGRITDTFKTPIVVPCETGFFYGLDMPAAANWPQTDGHSIWNAWYFPPMNRNIGENARNGAPIHAWFNIKGTTGVFPRSWRMGVLVRSPVLNAGGIDPNNTRQTPQGSSNYGAGGLYPDISGKPRRDGLDGRIEDQAHPTGVAFLIASTGFFSPPIGIANIPGGRVYLFPPTLLILGFRRMTGGVGVVPIIGPGNLPPALQGKSFALQGLVVHSTFVGLTNAQAVSF